MNGDGPARLTSALLVKKGNAAPAAYGLPAQSIAALVQDVRQGRKLFAPFGSAQEAPRRPVEESASVRAPAPGATPAPAPVATPAPAMTPAPVATPTRRAPRRRKPKRSDTRVRLSLRVEADRYLRLKLVSAHRRSSLQQVLTEAVDYYLEDIAPAICEGRCACLESGRIRELPPGGCRLA